MKHERVSPRLQGTLLSCGLRPAARRLFAERDPPTGAASRPRRKATRSTAPPQRGAPPEQGAAPTGAADSLPPAGAGVGAEDSPNCVKVVFCAPLRGLQLALFGGGDTTRPRPAAARCLPTKTGELRQIPTFTPPCGVYSSSGALQKPSGTAANSQQPAFAERGSLL